MTSFAHQNFPCTVYTVVFAGDGFVPSCLTLTDLDAFSSFRLAQPIGLPLYLGVVLEFLSGASVALLLEFGELARDVRRVAVEHRRVAGHDLPRVVQNDHLRGETLRLLKHATYK